MTYWWACNFFPIWLRSLISFLNDVDIQLILEFKNRIGKYHPVCPNVFFYWTSCIGGTAYFYFRYLFTPKLQSWVAPPVQIYIHCCTTFSFIVDGITEEGLVVYNEWKCCGTMNINLNRRSHSALELRRKKVPEIKISSTCTACPIKNPLKIFRTYCMIFSKTVFEFKNKLYIRVI